MKKLLSGITAAVLMLGLFTTGVQAKEQTSEKTMSYDQVVQMVEYTDMEINQYIDKAVNEANDLVSSHEAGSLSDKQFDKQLDKIIRDLQHDTDKMSQETVREAEKSGFVVSTVWIEVEIGGRTVSVDPCITDGL